MRVLKRPNCVSAFLPLRKKQNRRNCRQTDLQFAIPHNTKRLICRFAETQNCRMPPRGVHKLPNGQTAVLQICPVSRLQKTCQIRSLFCKSALHVKMDLLICTFAHMRFSEFHFSVLKRPNLTFFEYTTGVKCPTKIGTSRKARRKICE